MTGAAGGGPPSDRSFNRRSFLRLGVLVAGGTLFGACAKRRIIAPDPFTGIVDKVAERARSGLQVLPGGMEYIAGRDQRMTFGLVDRTGTSITGQSARVWIGAGRQARGPFEARYEAYRLVAPGDPHGFHVATLPFPVAGIVDLMVEIGGLYGFSTVQTQLRPIVPGAGQPAIAMATPTVGHPRGVKNICTRTPPCPMHSVRLDEALRARKPLVFTIASPKLCVSRTCGPVVDEILLVRARNARRANFIHAEVYKGDTATELSPTSIAWHLPSEPWTFVIDRGGVVRTRFEGPVVAAEIASALAAVP